MSPTLGPDATGVGWVFEYALVDRSGKHALQELRALQDERLRVSLARAWTLPWYRERCEALGISLAINLVLYPLNGLLLMPLLNRTIAPECFIPDNVTSCVLQNRAGHDLSGSSSAFVH